MGQSGDAAAARGAHACHSQTRSACREAMLLLGIADGLVFCVEQKGMHYSSS